MVFARGRQAALISSYIFFVASFCLVDPFVDFASCTYLWLHLITLHIFLHRLNYLVMHNVSPTALLCISVFSLVLSFLALPSLITQRRPPALDCFPPYQYLQPCVTILNCMVDCALNVLIGLNTTHWNEIGKSAEADP